MGKKKKPPDDDTGAGLPYETDSPSHASSDAGEAASEHETPSTLPAPETVREKGPPLAADSAMAAPNANSPPDRPVPSAETEPQPNTPNIPATEQAAPEQQIRMADDSTRLSEEQGPARPIPGRKLYQDELYGTKELSPLAVALIDTPEFQRLSHIFQLGFTYEVFRGANHRRFDHSVGTYFMVRTLMRRVVQNHARFHKRDPRGFMHPGLHIFPRLYLPAPATPPGCQKPDTPMGRWRGLMEVVSAAALLHDLGHVPVGHTLEDEFSVLEKHDSLGGLRLFEMLYGPRQPLSPRRSAGASKPTHQPRVTDFFGNIQTNQLPRPRSWGRVCLPWVFEEGIYAPFFASEPGPENGQNSPDRGPLQNWELRDLIYLLLSFKDDFAQELKTAKTKAWAEADKSSEESRKKAAANAAIQRVSFIEALYTWFSAEIDIGKEREKKPLFHAFMSDLVDNTICADLLDYLVRDGKRLKLEIRNNARLQRYLVIKARDSAFAQERELRLTINAVYPSGLKRRDTVSDLLDLMSERYRFAEVVYYHPKKAAFSAMLAKAIESIPKSSQPRDDGSIYPAPWSGPNAGTSEAPPLEQSEESDSQQDQNAPHIAHFGDESLIAYLREAAHKTNKRALLPLLDGITYRNEYRLFFTLGDEAAGDVDKFLKYLRPGKVKREAPWDPWDGRPELKDDDDRGRKQMEVSLQDVVIRKAGWNQETEPPPILVYCPNQRMQAKEVAAHVELSRHLGVLPLNRQPKDPTWNDIKLLNDKYKRLWRLYLFVHPRLAPMLEKDEELASTLIDSFCHRFGVSDEFKRSGCRDGYDYMPFRARLEAHFDNWRKANPLLLPRDTPFDEIRHRAENPKLWGALMDPQAPFPVNDGDYARGFAIAAMSLAAADRANRQGWGEVESIREGDWWEKSATPVVDTKRRTVLEELHRFPGALPSTATARGGESTIDTWEGLVSRLSASIKASLEREP